MAALKIVVNEDLAGNASKLGEKFRLSMKDYSRISSIVNNVRGKGLLNAIEIIILMITILLGKYV